MDAEQAGRVFGRQLADDHLRRFGVAVAAELVVRTAAREAWAEVARRLVDGTPDAAAFIDAYEDGYRGRAVLVHRHSPVRPSKLPAD